MKTFKNEKFDLDVNHKTNHINRQLKVKGVQEKLKAMMGNISDLISQDKINRNDLTKNKIRNTQSVNVGNAQLQN